MTNVRLLKASAVEQITSLSRTELHRRTKTGDFPQPVRLGAGHRRCAWIETEVHEWVAARIEESRGGGDGGRP